MDFETQWKKVVEKEALLQAELHRNLQRDILAEFEQMKSRVQQIDKDMIKSGIKGIDAKVSKQSIQFLNTNISFYYRDGDDSSGISSSIQVTQGSRGPREYFGVRSKDGEITWQIAGGIVIFKTEQLLEVLI